MKYGAVNSYSHAAIILTPIAEMLLFLHYSYTDTK